MYITQSNQYFVCVEETKDVIYIEETGKQMKCTLLREKAVCVKNKNSCFLYQ